MAGALVQELTQASNTSVTSVALTFTSTATADNLLITAIGIDKDGGTPTITESGWSSPVIVKSGTSSTLAYSYKVSAGTETVVTWNYTNHTYSAWVGEYSGLATSSAVDVSAVADSGGSIVNFQTSGTTATTTDADTFAVAMYSIDTGVNAGNGPRPYSNGFTEQSYAVDGSGPGLGVADKNITVTGTVESTFDPNGSDQMCGAVVVFKLFSAGPGPSGIPIFRRRLMQR